MLERNIQSENKRAGLRLRTIIQALNSAGVAVLVYFRVHTHVLGNRKEVLRREIRLQAAHAYLLHPCAGELIPNRKILQAEIRTIFYEIVTQRISNPALGIDVSIPGRRQRSSTLTDWFFASYIPSVSMRLALKISLP